jgi:hypothetical protein
LLSIQFQFLVYAIVEYLLSSSIEISTPRPKKTTLAAIVQWFSEVAVFAAGHRGGGSVTRTALRVGLFRFLVRGEDAIQRTFLACPAVPGLCLV